MSQILVLQRIKAEDPAQCQLTMCRACFSFLFLNIGRICLFQQLKVTAIDNQSRVLPQQNPSVCTFSQMLNRFLIFDAVSQLLRQQGPISAVRFVSNDPHSNQLIRDRKHIVETQGADHLAIGGFEGPRHKRISAYAELRNPYLEPG